MAHIKDTLQLLILARSNDYSEIQDVIAKAFEEHDDLKSRIIFGKKLCNLVLVNKSLPFIHCIANSLFNVFEEEVEKLSENREDISLNLLKVAMINFSTLLQTSYALSRKESTVQLMPAFSDILAAIVSLIIDVTILESQFITSKDECVEKGKRLVQTGLILLGKNYSKLLDSLIQTSTRHLPNADLVLMPLYQHTLLRMKLPNESMNEERYLQSLMASLQGIPLVQPRNASVSHDLRLAALQTPAPSTFYEWACGRKGGETVLSNTPLLQSTSPMGVTNFFMNECDMETMEQFLDLCNSGAVQEISEKTEKPSRATKESIKNKPSELLFVLDTKPDSSNMESKDWDVFNEAHDNKQSVESLSEDSGDEFLKETTYLLDNSPEEASEDAVDDSLRNHESSTDSLPRTTKFEVGRTKLGKRAKKSKKAFEKKKKLLLLKFSLGSDVSGSKSIKKIKSKSDTKRVVKNDTEFSVGNKEVEVPSNTDSKMKKLKKQTHLEPVSIEKSRKLPETLPTKKFVKEQGVTMANGLFDKGNELPQIKRNGDIKMNENEKSLKKKREKKLKKRKLKIDSEDKRSEANTDEINESIPNKKSSIFESAVKDKSEVKMTVFESSKNIKNETSTNGPVDNRASEVKTSLSKIAKKKALKKKKLLKSKSKVSLVGESGKVSCDDAAALVANEKIQTQESADDSVKATEVSDIKKESIDVALVSAADKDLSDVNVSNDKPQSIISPLPLENTPVLKIAAKSPENKAKLRKSKKNDAQKKTDDMQPMQDQTPLSTEREALEMCCNFDKISTTKIMFKKENFGDTGNPKKAGDSNACDEAAPLNAEINDIQNEIKMKNNATPSKEVTNFEEPNETAPATIKKSPKKENLSLKKLKKRKSTGNIEKVAALTKKSKKRRSVPLLKQLSQDADEDVSEITENSKKDVKPSPSSNSKKMRLSSGKIESPTKADSPTSDGLKNGTANQTSKKSVKLTPKIKDLDSSLLLKAMSEVKEDILSSESLSEDLGNQLMREEDELISKLPDIIRSTEKTVEKDFPETVTSANIKDNEPRTAIKNETVTTALKPQVVLVDAAKSPDVLSLAKATSSNDECVVKLNDDTENEQLNKSIKVALIDITEKISQQKSEDPPNKISTVDVNDTEIKSQSTNSESANGENILDTPRKTRYRKSVAKSVDLEPITEEKSDLLPPVVEEKVTQLRRSKRISSRPTRTHTDSESSTASSSVYTLRRSTRIRERTESESSTGSHGYRTRSRKM